MEKVCKERNNPNWKGGKWMKELKKGNDYLDSQNENIIFIPRFFHYGI